MDEHELYACVIKRMEIFSIPFEEAIKQIKEMYPDYIDILDKFVDPAKTQIEMTYGLWQEIQNLMYVVSSRECTEEQIQRQLGVVLFLYNREFDKVLW